MSAFISAVATILPNLENTCTKTYFFWGVSDRQKVRSCKKNRTKTKIKIKKTINRDGIFSCKRFRQRGLTKEIDEQYKFSIFFKERRAQYLSDRLTVRHNRKCFFSNIFSVIFFRLPFFFLVFQWLFALRFLPRFPLLLTLFLSPHLSLCRWDFRESSVFFLLPWLFLFFF